MKKYELVVIFGLILLGFSVYRISFVIYNVSWVFFNNYMLDWSIIDTLFTIWWILAPIVVLGIGIVVRYIETNQREAPYQTAQQVSEVIENIKFCTNCGYQNPKPALYCINCGEKIPV